MTRLTLMERIRTGFRAWRWRAKYRRRVRQVDLRYPLRFRSEEDWSYFLQTGRYWSKDGWYLAPPPGTPSGQCGAVDELLDDQPAEVARWRMLLDRELPEAERSRSIVWRYVVNFEDHSRAGAININED